MQYLTLFFETSDNKSSPMPHIFAMGASAAHWQTAFFVLRPVESILLIVNMLDFLRIFRVVFSNAGGFVWTLSIALFAICSVVGITSNLVAAILRAHLFELSSDGMAAVAVNDTATSASILLQFSDSAAALSLSSSIQPFTEAFTLLVLSALIIVVTNTCIRATTRDILDERKTKLWRSAAVLIFLLPRATFAAFEASVDAFQNNDYACLGACSASCTNKFSLMRSWLDFTPECRAFVALLSSPMLWILFLFLLFKIEQHSDRVRRRNTAAYLPFTTAEFESSSSSYLLSKVPSADASDLQRCR